ncbi:MAG: LarC family nickel insertion protein, partial [Thermodesulfobacteriota bacterium]|nr:LarC family nickel insertion protein [Thermodesulfobacteriota bacterium]
MGMKIAYFDCFSGISGDMILGAFMDLGVPHSVIEETIRNMPLEAFHLEVHTASRMHIWGQQVRVVVEEKNRARNYRDIRTLIEKSPLSDRVKALSLKVFSRLAEAEAAIHHCPKEEVHFHEVGGVDAIVDIIGAALALEWLNIDRVMASEIPLGRGFVTCEHGVLPVPPPATVALLEG